MRANSYKISSLYPAAFLHSKGARLVNIVPVSKNRSEFLFEDPELCKNLLDSYNYAPEKSKAVLVDARCFCNSIKSLKEKIYQ